MVRRSLRNVYGKRVFRLCFAYTLVKRKQDILETITKNNVLYDKIKAMASDNP